MSIITQTQQNINSLIKTPKEVSFSIKGVRKPTYKIDKSYTRSRSPRRIRRSKSKIAEIKYQLSGLTKLAKSNPDDIALHQQIGEMKSQVKSIQVINRLKTV